jgi:hypothetical protein
MKPTNQKEFLPMRKIFDRYGNERFVEDDYTLQDGERVGIPVNFMDNAKFAMHDGMGGPIGMRPGYCFSDDEAGRKAINDANAEYAERISTAWQQPVQQISTDKATPTSLTIDQAQAAHEEWLQNAWREGK